MSHPADKLPEPEPELPIRESASDNYNLVARAIFEVAAKLKDEQFASSVTSWGLDNSGQRPHEVALSMLEAIQKDASKMIDARATELKRLAEEKKSLIHRFGKAILQRIPYLG